MEEAPTQTSNPPRHKHLKSQTYFTLVRVVSECAKHSQLCRPARIDHQEPRPDDSSNELGDASREEVHKYSELIDPPCLDHVSFLAQNNLSTHESVTTIHTQDEGFSDTHLVIDEIENIMNTEEDDDQQKNLTVLNCTIETGFQGEGFSDLQKLLMDELEHVINGNEEVARDNNSEGNEEVARENSSRRDEEVAKDDNSKGTEEVAGVNNSNLTTGMNQFDGDTVAFSESQGYVDLQSNSVLDENADQLQADKERSTQNTNETIDSSLISSITCEVSKSSDNNEDMISLLRNNETGSNVVTEEKKMDFGKPVHSNRADSLSNHAIDGSEVEEGEISGEFEVSEKSVMSYGDGAVPHLQRKQLSEDVDRNKFPSSDKEDENRKKFVNTTTRGKVEANAVQNEMVCKRKIVVYEDSIFAEETHPHKRQKKDCQTKEPRKRNGEKGKKNCKVDGQIACSSNALSPIQNSDQTSGDKIIASEDKDAGEFDKKKRGPPSEQKKAKKKEKKRKKRAEQNRELGVKRLKLRPVEKPKPISYCRHYINGRCHEGEKCKFSHDTVPLTKSKPCCHFARNSCLKGDDCPFDHQLSKYPCSNYASTGFCIRGDGCLFSHTVHLKDDLPSTSNVSTPEPKTTSFPGTSTSKKQLDNIGTSRPSSIASPGTRGFISSKNTVQNVAKSVVSAPVLAPKGISFLSAGKSPLGESSHSTPSSSSLTRNKRLEDANKANQSTSEEIRCSNDTPKAAQPSIAPKGINFLSFGKVSKDTTQGVSGTASWLNSILQKNKLAASQSKSDVSSRGESSADDTRCKTQSGLLSSSVGTVDRNIRGEIPVDVLQSPRPISQLRTSSPSSSQPANYLAQSWLKDAPNSAQKALFSTLAFAAKCESEMKMKQSISNDLALSSRTTGKETGDRVSGTCTPINPKNDSVKALKILDFLSSVSGKKGSN
ncbi:Zinc finger CCCH domain-containing protein 65 [Euphorbia peplus]|nr:Zinc finger CCCH domain-containing protein 65 [Euphorbia peplus]